MAPSCYILTVAVHDLYFYPERDLMLAPQAFATEDDAFKYVDNRIEKYFFKNFPNSRTERFPDLGSVYFNVLNKDGSVSRSYQFHVTYVHRFSTVEFNPVD